MWPPSKQICCMNVESLPRDGNSDTGTRSVGYRYEDDFLLTGDTHIWTETGTERIFFLPVGNRTSTRYFSTVIILGCEQVKMCLFCYINYDLFWLLKFATRLSQIFVEYWFWTYVYFVLLIKLIILMWFLHVEWQIRYPPKTRRVWVRLWISTRRYGYGYEFLPVVSLLTGG
jgi:hypothetical protein